MTMDGYHNHTWLLYDGEHIVLPYAQQSATTHFLTTPTGFNWSFVSYPIVDGRPHVTYIDVKKNTQRSNARSQERVPMIVPDEGRKE